MQGGAGRWFSRSYAEAAGRFTLALQDCESAGHMVRHERLELGLVGPEGEPLCIDIGVIGDLECGSVVLSSSGVHGVEGYPGSAIQLACLDNIAKQDPIEGIALVFIHALNPYGMAWHRRFNESNVDLNRNFVPQGLGYDTVPLGYHHVIDFLNPKSPPKRREWMFMPKAMMLILRHGFNNLKQWTAEGQYEYPQNIQYGGKAMEKGPKLLVDWLKTNFSPVKRVFAVDLHTGLGPSGHDTLLLSADESADKVEYLTNLFPGHVEPLLSNEGVGYEIKGDLHQGLGSYFSSIDWTCFTQEFGTFKPVRVLRASRAENRWTQYGNHRDEKEARMHWSRENLLRVFNPKDEVWQGKLIHRGLTVYEIMLKEFGCHLQE